MIAVVVSATFITYSYVGYPALAWLVSRTRPDRHPPEAAPAAVSVVIAAYQEADVIEEKLRETLTFADEVSSLQIIVAVDGEDPTVDAARRVADPRIEVLHHPRRRGKSAAIADAVTRASGEILVFTDANARVRPGSVRALTRWFADPDVGVSSGAKHLRAEAAPSGREESAPRGEGAYWRYESLLKQWETRAGSTVAVVGELLAIRRELMGSLPSHIVNDDFFLAMHALRCGYSVVYEPAAATDEPASATLADERMRRRRIVAGRGQAGREWKSVLPYRRPAVMVAVASHKFTRPLVPWAALVGVASGLRCLLRPRRRGDRATGAVVTVVSAVFSAAALGAPHLPSRPAALRRAGDLCRMLANANVAALQGSVDHLRRRTTTLWPRVSRSTR